MTRTQFDGGNSATKFILHESWDFCRIRFQKEVAAETPVHIKNAIWVAKKAILDARKAERERLRVIGERLMD